MKELWFPRPLGGLVSLIIEVKGGNEDPFRKLGKGRGAEEVSEDIFEIFNIVIRAHEFAEILKIVEPGIVKDAGALGLVETSDGLQVKALGDPQSKEATGRGASKQIDLLEPTSERGGF